MAVELQRRDLEFLRWVNGFGFVTREAAAVWFGSGYRTAAARVAKLDTSKNLAILGGK